MRKFLAMVLASLAALLFVLAVPARFVRSQLLDTDTYVATVAPLASDPQVQAAVGARLTEELTDAVDVPALVERVGLPADGNLSSLLTGALNSFISTEVNKFLATPQFAKLWTEANRVAHTQVERIITNDDSGAITTQGNDVVVDLGVIFAEVKDRLSARGLTVVDKLPDRSIPITLFSVERLEGIQRAAHLLDVVASWLPWIALLLLAAAAWLAPKSRGVMLAASVVTFLLAVLLLLVLRWARGRYATTTALTDVWDQLTHSLHASLATLAGAALVMFIWLFFCGPSRVAVATRTFFDKILDRVPAPQWTGLARWQPWITFVLVVLGAWLLLRSPQPATVVWLTLAALLVTAVFTVLRRPQLSNR